MWVKVREKSVGQCERVSLRADTNSACYIVCLDDYIHTLTHTHCLFSCFWQEAWGYLRSRPVLLAAFDTNCVHSRGYFDMNDSMSLWSTLPLTGMSWAVIPLPISRGSRGAEKRAAPGWKTQRHCQLFWDGQLRCFSMAVLHWECRFDVRPVSLFFSFSFFASLSISLATHTHTTVWFLMCLSFVLWQIHSCMNTHSHTNITDTKTKHSHFVYVHGIPHHL